MNVLLEKGQFMTLNKTQENSIKHLFLLRKNLAVEKALLVRIYRLSIQTTELLWYLKIRGTSVSRLMFLSSQSTSSFQRV
jgi:hypothetical protein